MIAGAMTLHRDLPQSRPRIEDTTRRLPARLPVAVCALAIVGLSALLWVYLYKLAGFLVSVLGHAP